MGFVHESEVWVALKPLGTHMTVSFGASMGVRETVMNWRGLSVQNLEVYSEIAYPS